MNSAKKIDFFSSRLQAAGVLVLFFCSHGKKILNDAVVDLSLQTALQFSSCSWRFPGRRSSRDNGMLQNQTVFKTGIAISLGAQLATLSPA